MQTEDKISLVVVLVCWFLLPPVLYDWWPGYPLLLHLTLAVAGGTGARLALELTHPDERKDVDNRRDNPDQRDRSGEPAAPPEASVGE